MVGSRHPYVYDASLFCGKSGSQGTGNHIGRTYSKSSLNDLPQLLRLYIAGICDWDVSALLHDLLCCVCPLGVSPSRVSPPLFDSLYFLQVSLLFFVEVAHVCWHGVGEGHVLMVDDVNERGEQW